MRVSFCAQEVFGFAAANAGKMACSHGGPQNLFAILQCRIALPRDEGCAIGTPTGGQAARRLTES
ncbi:hypothetical protein AAV94_14195 [Lampropedia cohaerens]|uniref:Uncharacterized protein n=1 Tax=Lampropedia cohaerens TaxID=1610491 RepID=A0A0U1PWJ7_9BURK|nr:hypothetical protein AAV94_14195 [Lampropedia cohaerens]